jgi:uncharacterized coiled-coil DUF342 family protein
MPSPDADEVCARIERMKTLCDQLDAVKSDQRRYRELIDRIRQEADAFRKTLTTHDPT